MDIDQIKQFLKSHPHAVLRPIPENQNKTFTLHETGINFVPEAIVHFLVVSQLSAEGWITPCRHISEGRGYMVRSKS